MSGIPNDRNRKIVRMMKDEAGRKIIKEFAGLRAKLYSHTMFEGKEEKRHKGIKKAVVEKNITQDDYKECLFSGNMLMRKMNVIRSQKLEVFTEVIKKIALSTNDDKRIVREDKISSFAPGHHQLNQ